LKRAWFYNPKDKRHLKIMSARTIRAPRGRKLNCKGWHQEAALRCLMNNLDPDVAERPEDLVVYGGAGKAARNWESFDAIVHSLQTWKTMRLCWSSQESRSGFFVLTNTRLGS